MFAVNRKYGTRKMKHARVRLEFSYGPKSTWSGRPGDFTDHEKESNARDVTRKVPPSVRPHQLSVCWLFNVPPHFDPHIRNLGCRFGTTVDTLFEKDRSLNCTKFCLKPLLSMLRESFSSWLRPRPRMMVRESLPALQTASVLSLGRLKYPSVCQNRWPS